MKKLKKLVSLYRDKEQKYLKEIKELSADDIAKQDKKEWELLRQQNKKLKVELEQTKILNAKYKEDIERGKLEFQREMCKQERLKRSGNTVINAQITVDGSMINKYQETQEINEINSYICTDPSTNRRDSISSTN